MGRGRGVRRAFALASSAALAAVLGLAATPAAAADVTVTIGPAPDYTVSQPDLTVTIGDVITYQNQGNGSGIFFDLHVLQHLPSHWIDVVVYSTTFPPSPSNPEPSKFVWPTGPWAEAGMGVPPYGVGVTFPPITTPTTITLICAIHGPSISQNVTLIPAGWVDPDEDPDPTPTDNSQVVTQAPTLPPTDAASPLPADQRSGSGLLVAALLLVPTLLSVLLLPSRRRRDPRRP